MSEALDKLIRGVKDRSSFEKEDVLGLHARMRAGCGGVRGEYMSTQTRESQDLRCSFCNKDRADVRGLIAGPTVFICDECIDVCNEIIADGDREKGFAHERSRAQVHEDIKKFLDDASHSLHPVIAHRVSWMFGRGQYGSAVFSAFHAVEVAVRRAAAIENRCGTDLMRAAFDPHDGPLTDKKAPVAEREALMHLMSGAVGVFKAPRSHRNFSFDHLIETVEAFCFASRLLRIVDRAANRFQPGGQTRG